MCPNADRVCVRHMSVTNAQIIVCQQVMAAHMVSIARREYESDWTWRGSAAKPSTATPEQAAEAPRPAADGRVGLRSSQAGGSSGAARAATAVLEAAPPGADASFNPSSSGRAAPAVPASGEPVEPKRVLYSYYTVRLCFWVLLA